MSSTSAKYIIWSPGFRGYALAGDGESAAAYAREPVYVLPGKELMRKLDKRRQ